MPLKGLVSFAAISLAMTLPVSAARTDPEREAVSLAAARYLMHSQQVKVETNLFEDV